MTVLWPTDPSKLPVQRHLLLSTIRLEVLKPTGAHVGTGAFVQLQLEPAKFVNAIITNKHVLRNGQKVFGRFRRRTADHFVIDDGVLIELSPPMAIFLEHPNPQVDVAAIVIPPLNNIQLPDGSSPGVVTIGDNLFDEAEASLLDVGNDVSMVGYPIGLYDQVHNLPIVRQGTLATPFAIDFNGKHEFVVDIGAFRGSSGSPIFLMNIGSWAKDNTLYAGNRIIWLGLLWGGQVLRRGKPTSPEPVPTAADDLDSDDIFPLNLGHCIKASEVLAAKSAWFTTLQQMQLLP